MTKHDNVSREGIMKATEFVREFGIHIADQCLNDCASPGDKWFIHRGELICGEDFDDLKRLVESHESVQSHGGLECAKKTVNYPFYLDKPDCGTCYRLSKAIADVEACQ